MTLPRPRVQPTTGAVTKQRRPWASFALSAALALSGWSSARAQELNDEVGRLLSAAKLGKAKAGISVLDLQTGEVHWSSAQPGHATIAVADGKLWLLNDRGELIVIRANRERIVRRVA